MMSENLHIKVAVEFRCGCRTVRFLVVAVQFQAVGAGNVLYSYGDLREANVPFPMNVRCHRSDCEFKETVLDVENTDNPIANAKSLRILPV